MIIFHQEVVHIGNDPIGIGSRIERIEIEYEEIQHLPRKGEDVDIVKNSKRIKGPVNEVTHILNSRIQDVFIRIGSINA